jgi:hypothetical protein
MDFEGTKAFNLSPWLPSFSYQSPHNLQKYSVNPFSDKETATPKVTMASKWWTNDSDSDNNGTARHLTTM